MTSFGGFNGNPLITNFIDGIQSEFTNMVCSYSILLSSYQKKIPDVITIATRQVYPRIGLRLAAAKDPNNNNSPLFAQYGLFPTQQQMASVGGDSIRETLFQNILVLMTDSSSPYSEGITSVAAALTASILIRQLPLNGDIKNIELGNQIEKIALDDLDTITKVFIQTKNTAIDQTITAEVTKAQTIFIALDIDKNTLPDTYFNVDPVIETLSLEAIYPNANVLTLDSLTIPNTELAYCYYYVSGTEYESVDLTSSIGISTSSTPTLTIIPPTEGAFFVHNGYDADDIVNNLADGLNEAALNANRETNVICAPNRGELTVEYVTFPKKKLYPTEIDKTYDKKLINLRLMQRVNFLVFEARRLSSIVSKELVIVKFFTISKIQVATSLLSSNASFSAINYSYIGIWNSTTSYSIGEIIDINGASYVCIQTNTNINPLNDTIKQYWFPLYTEAADLIPYNTLAQPSIDGLIYGLNDDYNDLDSTTPVSVVLQTQHGNLKVVTNNSSSATKFAIDTFYFQLDVGVTSVTGELKIRVSSTNLDIVPNIFGFINSEDKTLTLEFTNATAEEVALEILAAVFNISEYTDVLASLAFPAALQFTAFRRTPAEVHEVIDIIEVPVGLLVATGTSLIAVTPYKNKARSLIINAIPIPVTKLNTSLIDNNSDYGTASATFVKAPSSLQKVYDKITLLKGKY